MLSTTCWCRRITVRGSFRPEFFGANGDLSTVAAAVTAGSKLTVFIEGPGVDQVPGNGFLISSPFITIDASTLRYNQPRVQRRWLVST